MNLVSSTLLLSAGLLASPALAEVTRLRGSAAKADMAAEEDRAALRALQDAFSVPLPEFQDLPDIVPGVGVLPPGAEITSRIDEVAKVLEAKRSRASEITFHSTGSFNDDGGPGFGFDDDFGGPGGPGGPGFGPGGPGGPPFTPGEGPGFGSGGLFGPGGPGFGAQPGSEPEVGPGPGEAFASTYSNQKVARAGSASEFQGQQIVMAPVGPSNGFIQEARQDGITKRGNVAGEGAFSGHIQVPGFAYGYYYDGKVAGAERASEFRAQAVAANEDGPQASYYYEVQKDGEDFAQEANFHEYALQFSFSLPATTAPATLPTPLSDDLF